MSQSTERLLLTRLCALMFLEIFVWGAWFTSVAVYMSAHGLARLAHWPFTLNAIAAICAPVLAGYAADRLCRAEWLLGLLHGIGGLAMLAAPSFIDTPAAFTALLGLYNLCFMPTLGLANTVAFRNLRPGAGQFPWVRMFGTIGWIAAGLVVSFVVPHLASVVEPERTGAPLYLAGGVSLLLSSCALWLPKTEPQRSQARQGLGGLLGTTVLRQMGSLSFHAFLLCALLLCVPMAIYFNYTQIFLEVLGFNHVSATQTLGQAVEVLFLATLPWFLARWGLRALLLIGVGAWCFRYVLFSLAAGASGSVAAGLVLAGILLHGVCYDFFFVSGQVYIDERAPPALRGQAQGLFVVVTYGFGMLLGAQLGGVIYRGLLGPGEASLTSAQFQSFWIWPAAFAGVLLLVLALGFRDERASVSPVRTQPAA